MNTLTFAGKISLACAVLAGFTVLTGGVGILGFGGMTSDIRKIAEGPLPGIYSLGMLDSWSGDEQPAILGHIAASTLAEKARLESTVNDLEDKFQAELRNYEKAIQTPRARVQFEKMAPIQSEVMRQWSLILPLSRAGKTADAMAIWNGDMATALRVRRELFRDMFDAAKETGDEDAASALSSGASGRFWSILILLLSAGAGGGLAFFLVRASNGIFARVVTRLSDGAEQVSAASGLVSGSSQSLAKRASEQAASLEATSASSEQLASMTRKNAENSRQAAAVMTTVSDRVSDANRTLAGMVKSMHEIGESSNKISRIIKVIDEIAFQTNILALNAAVEAARAGEAGMGFAVVAEEVRNLAQRSAQAAKDTASLIEESIAKSGEGSRRLGEVAVSIQAVTEGAAQVRTLVDEVDASSSEQAKGIEQISKAIARMDSVTQQAAASAEESASASEEINAQSQALMGVVDELRSLVGAAARGAFGAADPFRHAHTAPVFRDFAAATVSADAVPETEATELKEF